MRHLPFVIIFVLILTRPATASSIEIGPEVGKRAPAFELLDLSGKKQNLAEYSGKVVLLNFWATWCGPCKAEMPSLNSLFEEFKTQGFVVIAVSIDASEKPVQSFVSKQELTFPVLMDPDKEVYFDEYAVFALPTSVLIDRNGIIAHKFIGATDWTAPNVKERMTTLLKRR